MKNAAFQTPGLTLLPKCNISFPDKPYSKLWKLSVTGSGRISYMLKISCDVFLLAVPGTFGNQWKYWIHSFLVDSLDLLQSLTVVDPIYFQAKINITILRSWCPLYCCFSWSVWNHWTIPVFKKCCQLLWSEVRVSVLYRLGQAHDDFLSASISTASNYCRLKTAAERTGSENPLYLSSARELQTRKWWVCCRGVANEHQSWSQQETGVGQLSGLITHEHLW